MITRNDRALLVGIARKLDWPVFDMDAAERDKPGCDSGPVPCLVENSSGECSDAALLPGEYCSQECADLARAIDGTDTPAVADTREPTVANFATVQPVDTREREWGIRSKIDGTHKGPMPESEASHWRLCFPDAYVPVWRYAAGPWVNADTPSDKGRSSLLGSRPVADSPAPATPATGSHPPLNYEYGSINTEDAGEAEILLNGMGDPSQKQYGLPTNSLRQT